MKKLLLALLLVAMPATAGTLARSFDRELSADNVHRVHVKIGVGDLEVTAAAGNQIKVHVEVFCDHHDCGSAAGDVELSASYEGDRLLLEVKGASKLSHHDLSVNLDVQMPAALALETDTGVGDVKLSGLTGNVEVDTGVGDVEVELDPSAVKSVKMNTGVGDAELWIAGHRIDGSGFVGKGLTWSDGSGPSTLEIDCGVGDAKVRLK